MKPKKEKTVRNQVAVVVTELAPVRPMPSPILRWLEEQGLSRGSATMIFASVNIRKTATPSGLWRYFGLAVRNGQAEPTPRTALKREIMLIGADFVAAHNPRWMPFYLEYQKRKSDAGWGSSPEHVHVAAVRFMMKQFLLELYRVWREAEGLPTTAPFPDPNRSEPKE